MGYGGYGKLGGCCCEAGDAECFDACEGDRGPLCWKVTISGFANADGGTPDGFADNMNGVHYVRMLPDHANEDPPVCEWECENTFFSLELKIQSAQVTGGNDIVLGISGSLVEGGQSGPRFTKSDTEKFDCFASHELTWDNTSGGDGSNATCIIEPAECDCIGEATGLHCRCAKCAMCIQGQENIIGYRVVVSGLQDGTECDGSELNGTYDFDWVWDNAEDEPADPAEGHGQGDECTGRTISVANEVSCSCGNGNIARLDATFRTRAASQFGATPKIEFKIDLLMQFGTTGAIYNWTKDIGGNGSLADCMLNGEEMDSSHLTITGQPFPPPCGLADASSATVTVTALTA